jgi:hypothetical protein
MKSIKKLLVSSIVLIVIGFLGLGIICILGIVSSGITNYGTGQGYMFGQEDFCNMGRNNASVQEDNNLSFESVKNLAEDYISGYGQNLKITEIMEFSKNYYIEVIEEDSGSGAMELLVDKSTGNIFQEYGPNMMWNLKYGMHAKKNTPSSRFNMPIDEEKAIELASSYLAKSGADEVAENEAERFYGYYTIHTTDKDGNILGMLSVNGFSGDVWYHSWHGVFIEMEEYN